MASRHHRTYNVVVTPAAHEGRIRDVEIAKLQKQEWQLQEQLELLQLPLEEQLQDDVQEDKEKDDIQEYNPFYYSPISEESGGPSNCNQPCVNYRQEIDIKVDISKFEGLM